jgi:signal transduction histidine kinase
VAGAEDLLRPVPVAAVLVLTTAQLVVGPTPTVVLALIGPVAVAAVASLFRWDGAPPWFRIAVASVFLVPAAAMFPLAPSAGKVLPFLAAAVAGEMIASRRAAIAVATVGAVTCAVSVLVCGWTDWPWWLCLSVGAPVYIGIARQDTERARRSEAREVALVERSRIAREIHDVLGHSLSGIALQLATADALHVNGRDEEANQAVQRARALAVSSLTETKRAVHALREDTLPLPETLRLLAAGSDAAFAVVGPVGPVPVESAQTVVRVAQEALTNAAKHAPDAARSVELAFDRHLRLTVHNGRTNRTAPESVGGMGLVGLRERAALLGGTLCAAPDDSGGWTVELELPR